jgi:hypothetical protein
MNLFKKKVPLSSATFIVLPQEAGIALTSVTYKQYHYRSAIRLFDEYAQDAYYSVSDILRNIDFILDLVKRDLQSDYLTQLIYTGSDELQSLAYLDSEKIEFSRLGGLVGKEVDLQQTKIVNLAVDTVFVRAWNKVRLFRSVQEIGTECFDFACGNHKGIYYKHMNYGWIENGNHSITAAIQAKAGEIILPLIDETPLFSILETDGAYWINSKTMRVLGETEDFRLALIYTLTRRRLEIERSTTGPQA